MRTALFFMGGSCDSGLEHDDKRKEELGEEHDDL
jgi:hypothetical protein